MENPSATINVAATCTNISITSPGVLQDGMVHSKEEGDRVAGTEWFGVASINQTGVDKPTYT